MSSLLQVPSSYQTAGFSLAGLDETESAGNTNDSIFVTVLTVSPHDTRELTNISFVDNIQKGQLVFTRNLTKTCLENDVYLDTEPNWPEQRTMSWDRPGYLKNFKVDFSPADYLEAGTIDQVNYHLFELSKIRKFKPNDIHRLFNRWRLAGISSTQDVSAGEYDGAERMIQLQVAGRAVVANYFDGPATPTAQRHIFVAMKFVRLADASDPIEYNLNGGDSGYVNALNTRPSSSSRLATSKREFDDDTAFQKRLIPQLFYASSFHENIPKEESSDANGDILFHRIGHVLMNNSSYGYEAVSDRSVKTTINLSQCVKRREMDVHVNLHLF
jgi:hypothetical protein